MLPEARSLTVAVLIGVRGEGIFDGGHAIKYRDDRKYDRLPEDYLAQAATVRTPVLLMTGRHNHVFMGKDVAVDIFPSLVDFFRRRGGATAGQPSS